MRRICNHWWEESVTGGQVGNGPTEVERRHIVHWQNLINSAGLRDTVGKLDPSVDVRLSATSPGIKELVANEPQEIQTYPNHGNDWTCVCLNKFLLNIKLTRYVYSRSRWHLSCTE